MSYILEALKKAQAERQLGSAPTIHALPIHAAGEEGAGARPKAVRIAVAMAVLAVAAIALLSWRQQAAAPTPPPLVVAASTPAAIPAPPPAAADLAPPPTVAPPAPAAAAAAPRPVAPTARAAAAHAPKPTPAKPEAAHTPTQAAPVAEDLPPTLRELPDAVQREVPQVAIGGYIYSKNPEDRLLLIDKVLRHEGEEIAPGLTLEKLLPKAAVMRYKAYRYRVPY